MIEIIPNWHPIFVHFTIGLLGVSALLYMTGMMLKREHLLLVARWNLWIGAFVTVGTVLAGWYAYNTVNHDGPSHTAMIDHRNWAITTAITFILLALWAFFKQRGAKTVSPVFVTLIVIAAGMLAVTGYKGGEVVYRHGLGVMRMPEVNGDGGHTSHHHESHDHSAHHQDEEAKSAPQDHSGHNHKEHHHE